MAAKAGLEGSEVPESQEICFVPDDDHRRFLRERLGDTPGDIVDVEGHRLGHHSGVYNFTVGQRKGLGLSTPEPRFVIRVDPATREVVVGEQADVRSCGLTVEQVTWHRPLPAAGIAVQVRSGGEPLPAFTRSRASASEGMGGGGGQQLVMGFDPPPLPLRLGRRR